MDPIWVATLYTEKCVEGETAGLPDETEEMREDGAKPRWTTRLVPAQRLS